MIGGRRRVIVFTVLLCVFASLGVSAQAPAAQGQEEQQEPMSLGISLAELDALMQEESEDLGDLLRAELIDVALLSSFLALALWSFFRKSLALKYVTLVAAVGYLGFAKGALVSIVNIFGVINWNFPLFRYNVSWYLLITFAVVSTVLWGRLYCGRICAFGALTQLMDAVLPAQLRVEPPPWIGRRAIYVKYGLLAAAVAYFAATRDNSIYRYVEPFWMFTLSGSTAMWILLAILLVATVFVRNLYCRYLCPVGAALGLLSNLSVFRIKRWSECQHCTICERDCAWGAIQPTGILASECVRCDDCERLYADQDRCPHWLVLKRKELRASMAATTDSSPMPAQVPEASEVIPTS